MQPHPAPDVSKTMHIFEHWVAMRQVEVLVDFYRTQEHGRLSEVQQWALNLGLKNLGSHKKKAVLYLSLAADIEYMIEGSKI